MTDMFIPKKEKTKIILEAIIYILLVISAAYFTIYGNIVVRMIPMLYILGIFGVVMFKKPIVTIILAAISVFSFGILAEETVNVSVVLFAIYSLIMMLLGEITGQIINLLYQNYKLRKFIKYYHKIGYVIGLIACLVIPLILNNAVNSNIVSYSIAKVSVEQYLRENYSYMDCSMRRAEYKSGVFEFSYLVDNVSVELSYTSKDKVSDINMNKRKESLNRVANAEMNILLRNSGLTHLNVECKYDYSKISTNPDIIRISILNAGTGQIDDIVKYISIIKSWSKFNLVDRMDIEIEGQIVSIEKNALTTKQITATYIIDGLKHDILSSKEGI